MTLLALQIGSEEFVASKVEEGVDDEDIHRIPIPRRSSWEACRELLAEVAGGAEVTALGIASTGPIDMAAGVVAPPEIAAWRGGFGIVEATRKVFPAASVRLALDGVCLALAERSLGSAVNVPDALSISVSHQIAGGVMIGGFVAVGRTGNAGHIAHVLVPGFDEPCSCGGRGCLSAVASGAAAIRWAHQNGWAGTSLADLTTGADMGDELAAAAIARAGTALGRAIASVAALLDIDLVVVSGALAQAGTALWQTLGTEVAAHARVSYLPGLRVTPSKLGELGILAGAGVLAVSAGE